jgi:hypothetical protein
MMMKKMKTMPAKLRFSLKGRSPKIALLVFMFLLGLISISCNLVSLLNKSTQNTTSSVDLSATLEANMSLDQALATTPEDNRPEIMRQMGSPDAFTLTFEQLNGQTVRQEEWSYFDDKTRFDFVDGSLLWTVAIQPMPDATIFASTYDPQDFKPDMTLKNVQALLFPQALVIEDTAANGIPGGQMVAGDQILLGFDHDQLVYVQTFPSMPEAKP